MKKLFIALAVFAFTASASSCKKCGYCEYSAGNNGNSVCKSGNPVLGVLDSYDVEESDCKAAGGKWVKTK